MTHPGLGSLLSMWQRRWLAVATFFCEHPGHRPHLPGGPSLAQHNVAVNTRTHPQCDPQPVAAVSRNTPPGLGSLPLMQQQRRRLHQSESIQSEPATPTRRIDSAQIGYQRAPFAAKMLTKETGLFGRVDIILQ